MIFKNTLQQLKILLSQIQEDWKEITDEEELEILKKNAEESRLMSLFYISKFLDRADRVQLLRSYNIHVKGHKSENVSGALKILFPKKTCCVKI